MATIGGAVASAVSTTTGTARVRPEAVAGMAELTGVRGTTSGYWEEKNINPATIETVRPVQAGDPPDAQSVLTVAGLPYEMPVLETVEEIQNLRFRGSQGG